MIFFLTNEDKKELQQSIDELANKIQQIAIPTITPADEGKILQVVDGRLQFVNISFVETQEMLLSLDGYVLKDKNDLYLILSEGE